MKSFLSVLVIGCLTLYLVNCSSGGGSSSSPSNLNEAAGAVSEAKSKINDSQLLNPDGFSATGVSVFNADWTAAHLSTNSGDCAVMTSPKGHLQELQNPNCSISPLFDLNNLFGIVCAVVNSLTTDEDGNPDVFNGNVTVSSATVAACGIDGSAAGQSMPVVVEAVTSDDYVRKLTVTTGPKTRIIYWGKNEDAFALSFYYDDTSDYKGFYYYEYATSTMAFELQSARFDQNTVGFYRIFMDESVNPAVVSGVGSYGDRGNGDNVRWTVKGDRGGVNEIAVSMRWDGQEATGVNNIDTCVNPSNFAANGVDADCDVHSAPSLADFDNRMQLTYTSINGKNATTYANDFGSDDSVGFDDTDIATRSAVE